MYTVVCVNGASEMIDYAKPAIEAERALKEMHWAFLAKDMEKAKEKALEASYWSMKVWEALRAQA